MESKQKLGRLITVVATFLAFSGIGVVDPILPIIAEKIGATHWQVEMLFTAYILTMAIMMLPAGIFASRFGDKRMMTIGLAIVTVFAFICGISQTIAQLSLFRAGWGLGNAMFFATAMTLLIALSKEVHEAVGLYEAAIGLGMAGGPLLGGILGGHSWRYPFFATSILIFLAFILVFFFVKEPERKVKRKAAGVGELLNLVKYKPFMQGAISGMLYYYGFFVVLAYSPLIMHLSAIQLGFVFCGWGLALAYGSAILAHKLEGKYEPKTLLKGSLLVFAIFLIALFFVKIMWLQITLIVLSGLASGLNNALYTSYVMDISPYERSVTSGVYNFVRWLGGAIAPILSGVMGHTVSPQSPFLVGGIVVLVGCIMILIPIRKPVELEKKTLS